MLGHAAEHSCEDILHKIDVPVLIVAGEHDTFTPVWLSEKMHCEIPDSEMLMVPDGTHTAPIELPELVCLRLEKWLGTHFDIDTRFRSRAHKRIEKQGLLKAGVGSVRGA